MCEGFNLTGCWMPRKICELICLSKLSWVESFDVKNTIAFQNHYKNLRPGIVIF